MTDAGFRLRSPADPAAMRCGRAGTTVSTSPDIRREVTITPIQAISSVFLCVSDRANMQT